MHFLSFRCSVMQFYGCNVFSTYLLQLCLVCRTRSTCSIPVVGLAISCAQNGKICFSVHSVSSFFRPHLYCKFGYRLLEINFMNTLLFLSCNVLFKPTMLRCLPLCSLLIYSTTCRNVQQTFKNSSYKWVWRVFCKIQEYLLLKLI